MNCHSVALLDLYCVFVARIFYIFGMSAISHVDDSVCLTDRPVTKSKNDGRNDLSGQLIKMSVPYMVLVN
jgi:hypothetical protein